jgi:hypothetical protein
MQRPLLGSAAPSCCYLSERSLPRGIRCLAVLERARRRHHTALASVAPAPMFRCKSKHNRLSGEPLQGYNAFLIRLPSLRPVARDGMQQPLQDYLRTTSRIQASRAAHKSMAPITWRLGSTNDAQTMREIQALATLIHDANSLLAPPRAGLSLCHSDGVDMISMNESGGRDAQDMLRALFAVGANRRPSIKLRRLPWRVHARARGMSSCGISFAICLGGAHVVEDCAVGEASKI